MDEWISKKQYIPAMEYYSALKRKEILQCTTIWMNLEDIMLSEIASHEKTITLIIPLMWSASSRHNHRGIKVEWCCQGLGKGGNGELLFDGCRVQFYKIKGVMEMDGSDGCTTLSMYLIPQNCILKNG